ncbi:GNAT family N-acetyltransferase [Xanthobacteraceae bacterium A53D]
MSDAGQDVRREDGPNGGRYVLDLGPEAEAEMTFGRDGHIMTVDHTGVPYAFRGRGIAALLVEAAVADARAEGFRIRPLCSYVVAQFRAHPEWGDVLA